MDNSPTRTQNATHDLMSALPTTAIPTPENADLGIRLSQLNIYPIKSCGGVSPSEALLIETGLEFDRAWMLVDPRGVHVTQRTVPRMALVSTQFRHGQLVLRAPGMLALHVELDKVAATEPMRVMVWRDEVSAYDMGDLARQWFTDFLGTPVQLVRFDPDQKRISDRAWTGDIEAETAFADGFAVLVVSQASLDALNGRLATLGEPAVTLQRFRPNIVLDGLEAHQEDELDELRFETQDGLVRLKLVKPCTRCVMPNIDPLTAEMGDQPNDVLATYRGNPLMGGAVTFGMNAIVVEGVDCLLKTGMLGGATYKF
jgi:uncharacterized protein YcbX